MFLFIVSNKISQKLLWLTKQYAEI